MAGEKSTTTLLRAIELEREESSISKSTEDSDTVIKEAEQTSSSKLPKVNISDALSEQASTSKYPEGFSTSKLMGHDGTIKSPGKQPETGISQAEHEHLIKLERLRKDSPKLKFLNRINVGNLFSICHNHPEFQPLIINMFQAYEFVNQSWNRHDQELFVGTSVKIETSLNELVSMKDNPDTSSDDMKDKFDGLNRYITEFTGMLHNHVGVLHGGTLKYATYNSKEAGKECLKQREKNVHECNIKESVKPKTYLSSSIDTELLTRIAHEHSELRPSVKCTLSVISAMDYLDYEGQVKVYKILLKVVDYIKNLIHQKYNPDLPPGSNVDETTTELISCVFKSFTEIMSNLSQQYKKSSKKTVKCLRCPRVMRFVKDVEVEPQLLELKDIENPHSNLKGVVAHENHGISQDRLMDLNSLFLHLSAKIGGFKHAWLYKDCVNWIKIAIQYRAYRKKARKNLKKMKMLRSNFERRFDEYEEIMALVKEFDERSQGIITFDLPDNLSEEIALKQQMELLISEEDYLMALDPIIEHFRSDLKKYMGLNSAIQKSRHLFLKKKQSIAFKFPPSQK